MGRAFANPLYRLLTIPMASRRGISRGLATGPARRSDVVRLSYIECCGRRLPLRLSQQGETAALWLCAHCDRPYAALGVPSELLHSSRHIKLAPCYGSSNDLQPLADAMRRKISALVERERHDPTEDRRRSPRKTHFLVTPAINLSFTLTPEGMPYSLVVTDISREGVGLVHDAPIVSSHIGLILPIEDGEPIQVFARVVRVRNLNGELYQIGAEFVARLLVP